MEIGPDAIGLLEGGSALVVGSVGPDGMPRAVRGWGARVLDPPDRLRLMLDAEEDATLAHLRDSGRIAVTGCDVPTLRSVQVKGRVELVEPPTALDLALQERCTDRFFRDVEDTDQTPRHLLDRMLPREFVACVVVIEDVFDQTPGPAAGASIVGRTT